MKRIAYLLSAIALATMLMGAGSGKFTTENTGKFKSLILAWTSDASGDADAATYQFRGGTIYGFIPIPESGVTDAYDVVLNWTKTVKTESSTRSVTLNDALGGQGANLSNSTNGDYISLDEPASLGSGALTPVISNAGNATSGTIILVVWEE